MIATGLPAFQRTATPYYEAAGDIGYLSQPSFRRALWSLDLYSIDDQRTPFTAAHIDNIHRWACVNLSRWINTGPERRYYF